MIPQIAVRVAGLSYSDLSEEAQERLKLCLLSNLSVGLAGVPYVALPEPFVTSGAYRLMSGRCAANPYAAAFWNGAVMHARTQDDFDPLGNIHVGTVVLPALLAECDRRPMSGRQFLEALAVGYMVAVGLSRYCSSATSPKGFRSTGYFSPFGAAAAIAKARGLDKDRIVDVLGLTTAFAGGTTQTWIDGSDEWQLHPAIAARTGLEATDYAEAGARGGAGGLDGSAGLYHALLGECPSFDVIEPHLEPSISIVESVIKRFPVSGICQSVVLAAEAVAARIDEIESIETVQVEMNGFEMRYPGTSNRGPTFRSFGDRLMSAAFCTASVLANGCLTLQDFQTSENPARDRLLPRISLAEDGAMPLLSARVTALTTGGAIVSETVRNARQAINIDWSSVKEWGSELWNEAGMPVGAFAASYAAIRELDTAVEVDLGPWHRER